jgi:hypothetical protein
VNWTELAKNHVHWWDLVLVIYVSDLDEVDCFNLPNPSSRTMSQGSTQPLTEMSTKDLLGGKWQLAPKADNLTAICEPTV